MGVASVTHLRQTHSSRLTLKLITIAHNFLLTVGLIAAVLTVLLHVAHPLLVDALAVVAPTGTIVQTLRG